MKRLKTLKKDLTGYENNYLKVIEYYGNKKYSKTASVSVWKCICKNCGNVFNVCTPNILKEKVKSCGCNTFTLKSAAHKKHGMFGTRLYRSWAHMISRCENANVPEYKNYGGRGIYVCEEWHDFNIFYKWAMNNGYTDLLTIDRIDVDKEYSPSNCRWVDMLEQVRNRRNTVYVTIDEVTKPLAEWCEIYNMDYKLAYKRIFTLKWDAKNAFTQPKRKGA